MTLPLRNGRLRISQGTLFWREVGYGPTLVLIHGSWTDSSQWMPLMESLGQSFHCLAPDLLGFGESSRPPVAYSIALEVACLAEFLAGVRSPAVVFVADSLGAWVATQYALTFPDQVRGLVVMAPEGIATPTHDQRWQSIRWLAGRGSLRLFCLRLLAPLVTLGGGGAWLRQVRQRRRELRRAAPACRLLFQRRKAELAAEWLNDRLPSLSPPVLVLCPQGAEAIPQDLTRRYGELARHSIVQAVAGHAADPWGETACAIAAFATPLMPKAMTR